MNVTSKSLPLALGALLAFYMPARATLFTEDHFDYGAGNLGTTGASGGWVLANGGVTTAPGSLDGTGFGLAPSSGGKVTTTSSSSSGTYNQFSSGITADSVYFSFLLSVNSPAGLTVSGQPLVGLLKSGSSSSFYADVYLGLSGSDVQVGVSKTRTATLWDNPSLVAGRTYLIVGEYQFVSGTGNDVVSLWVNPSLGAGEPVRDVMIIGGGDGSPAVGIGRCFIYGGASTDMDELRIGSTWADVTPIPEPSALALMGLAATALTAGAAISHRRLTKLAI